MKFSTVNTLFVAHGENKTADSRRQFMNNVLTYICLSLSHYCMASAGSASAHDISAYITNKHFKHFLFAYFICSFLLYVVMYIACLSTYAVYMLKLYL